MSDSKTNYDDLPQKTNFFFLYTRLDEKKITIILIYHISILFGPHKDKKQKTILDYCSKKFDF